MAQEKRRLKLRDCSAMLSSRIYASLIVALLLAACEPATTKNVRQDKQPSTNLSATSPSPSKTTPSDIADTQASSDIVGSIISQIENQTGEEDAGIAPEDEVLTAAAGQAARVDEATMKREALAEQALEAALSLLKNKVPERPLAPEPFEMPIKADGQFRIGMMLPFSGDYATLGRDIASGAELALFQLASANATLVYFDTAGGSRAAEAAREAVAAQVDIIIGPLFTKSVMQTRTIFAASAIPAISLSNNVQAATPGQWVLGYLPEQQIDHLLGHAISENSTKIAILASEDTFGQRLLSHTQNRLSSFGLQPAEVTTLPQELLADEESIKAAVQRFTRYIKADPDIPELPEPAYDALILAGNSEFILWVAPLLSYYDMDPSRVMFLGTDLWARPELLAEPSLQGAFITQALQPESTNFENRYQGLFNKPTNQLVKLGFDAFALVAITHQQASNNAANTQIDWRASLIRDEGFEGLSGRFNLLPDGQNQRFYKIQKLVDNKLVNIKLVSNKLGSR